MTEETIATAPPEPEKKPVIEASAKRGTRRMGTIIGLPPAEVQKAIGFDANIDDEPDMGASWGFTVDGVHCGVWYIRPTTLFPSCSGTKEALVKVFGAEHVDWKA